MIIAIGNQLIDIHVASLKSDRWVNDYRIFLPKHLLMMRFVLSGLGVYECTQLKKEKCIESLRFNWYSGIVFGYTPCLLSDFINDLNIYNSRKCVIERIKSELE
jgi:hypothetical protein